MMELVHTRRGFEVVIFEDDRRQQCSIQQSSAVGDSAKPGSSFLWFGPDHQGVGSNRMHLDREQVGELVKRMQAWLETGSLAVGEEKNGN